MGEHTPGPWVEFVDGGGTVSLVPAGRDGDVAIFADPLPSPADARLMAASPDLLAVAKGPIVSRVGDDIYIGFQDAHGGWSVLCPPDMADFVDRWAVRRDAAIRRAEGAGQ